MNIVHLTASTFHGGPERQMLGLAAALAEDATSTFLSFPESGRCRSFLSVARQQGHESVALKNDSPYFRACIREITEQLERAQADVLCCHGYKANILGRPAARRRGIPAVAVSRGWTGESFKVRWYERFDRFHLRFMDHVVAVSGAQAEKVRRAGVRQQRITLIPNAIDPERFTDADPRYRNKLERFFRNEKVRIVGAAGRLSPEKGFDVLLSAAARVVEAEPHIGFVIFGHGDCKQALQQQIMLSGLTGSVFLAGFRNDLDRFIPQLDLFVLPSYTEGMPNVVLESCAAGVAVVATAVGGTPEIIEDGVSGLLVPPGDPDALATRILDALESEDRLRELGFQGRQRVLESFSFSSQAEGYLALFESLCPKRTKEETTTPAAAVVEAPTATEDAALTAEPTCEH
jgi:glycosyltransferase involved in cell wall biosynthesis